MIIINEGGERDPKSLPLSTRRRNHIPNVPRLESRPSVLSSSVVDYKRLYPNAVLRSITAVYNCVGLPFASRRTCIEPDFTSMILIEDGYVELSNQAQAKIGDIVVYKHGDEVSHVGIVLEIRDAVSLARQLFVLSKWGPFGEYIHPIDEVPPLFGRPAEYWTDRR